MLYEKHSDLIVYDEFMLKYTRYDKDGNLLEIWERKDVNSPWKNTTEKHLLAEKIAALQAKLDKEARSMRKNNENTTNSSQK